PPPTRLHAAALPPGPTQHAHGAPLLPSLPGPPDPPSRGPIFWHYPHYSNQGGRPSAAVRQGRYKLIRCCEDEHCELYDLEQDVGEQHDLAAALPEVVEELRDALARHLREVGALIPQRNPWPEPFG